MSRRGTISLGIAAVMAVCQPAAAGEVQGQVRARVDGQTATAQRSVEAELRGRWQAITAAATFRHTDLNGHGTDTSATVNELYASGTVDGWRLSAGRKIVSWDVGQGFRPNDMVQQERRRALLPSMLTGRSVVQAEHFSADDAWSLVWVDPASEHREQAAAVRWYRRVGTADWHVFARHGGQTGASAGAAMSWVATDAVEAHASVRFSEELGGQHHVPQGLVGASWTGDNKIGVLAEAWYDGAAPSDAQWKSPAAVVLAARARELQNLRRRSLYARVSWEHEGWQPAVDLLWLPSDRSRAVTASLGWQGDRWRWDAGWRRQDGPRGSLLGTSPVHHIAYAAATWTF